MIWTNEQVERELRASTYLIILHVRERQSSSRSAQDVLDIAQVEVLTVSDDTSCVVMIRHETHVASHQR